MIGFFNVLKPTGVSSGWVVNKLKHILNEKRVGHLGTLDPMASGVLPVAVGKATRFFDYFLSKDKEYFALMKVGVETNTLDSDGQVVKRSDAPVSLEMLKKASSKFVGTIVQKPPVFSAKMVDGRRAYSLAKDGQEVKLDSKKVQIFSINVEKWHQNGVFALKIHCGAGTYVRSLVRDIAESVGTVATAVAIIRTRSGAFDIENSCTLDDIEKSKEKYLLSIQSVLQFPVFDLSPNEAKAIQDGKAITLGCKGECLALFNKKEFAILKEDEGLFRSKIYLYDGENI